MWYKEREIEDDGEKNNDDESTMGEYFNFSSSLERCLDLGEAVYRNAVFKKNFKGRTYVYDMVVEVLDDMGLKLIF